MPSKKKSSAASGSTALVRTRRSSDGDAEDVSKALVLRTPQQIRQEEGSFSKALVRRAQTGQGGAVVSNRGIHIEGGLDRLAALDDHLRQTKLRAPFDLEKLRKIADSQLDAHMDDIDALHRVDFFYDDISMHIKARVESLPDDTGKKRDMTRDPDFVARVIGTRIHYAFLSAASWLLIRDLLQDLVEAGVNDSNVKSKVHQFPPIREQYMLLYELAERVAEMERLRLGRITAASEHFSKYFTTKISKEGPQITFKKEMMKDVFINQVDLIMVELALPGDAHYSLYQLYALLHEAFADQPKEEKRLSQMLNDAIGDLSEVVQFLDMLDVPLSTADGKKWKAQDPVATPEFEEYVACQPDSSAALSNVAVFGRHVWPLEKTKDKRTLDSMWAAIDKSVEQELKGISDKKTLEELWGLENARQPSPLWSYTLNVAFDKDDKIKNKEPKQIADRPVDYDPYELAMVPTARPKKPSAKDKAAGGPKKKQLLLSNRAHDDDDGPPPLTAGDDDDDDEDLPALISMSDSSDSDDDLEDSDEEEEEDDDEFLDQRALDEFYREAMDPNSDLFDSMPDYVDEPEASKTKFGPEPPPKKVINPLKKLLAALTGRTFSADDKPTTQQRPSRAYFHRPEKSTARTALTGDPELPDLIPYVKPRRPGAPPTTAATPGKPAPPKSNVVIEEEEDNEAGGIKKKKKKKPKKKKTAGDAESIISSGTPEPAPSPQLPSETTKPSTPTPSPQKQPPKAASRSELDVSRIPSLPVSEASAQSSQSYLRSVGADIKTKIKTRGEAIIPEERAKKANLWTRILPKKDEKKEEEEKDQKSEGKGIFGAVKRFAVKKKTAEIMRHILQSADEDEEVKQTKVKPLKWEDFLRGMSGMGFEIDLTTAGSSVRFDPPNKNDRPISFHKPHPDPTLQPMMVKAFARRLKKHYGWMDENFKPWKE